MKNASAKKQAIVIAIVASLTSFLTSLILFLVNEPNFIITQVLISLIIFLFVYIIVFYSLNSFIYNKLKPIYKTIHDINFSEKQLKQDLEERDLDLVQNVKDDVVKWARNKTQEIAQLKKLEKYRREFLGNVSHELKTPIFNIQGYISTLLDGGLKDETINISYLERAEKSVNRLISIVDDLESISGLEAGELKLAYSNFNIIKLVEDVFEEHERLASELNIKLKVIKSQNAIINVYADKQRILEVLNNLIANSIKYGKKGGQTTLEFLDMDDHILIEISDNGIGISKNDLPRIFERFYRTDKSRSREMGGTGLGLSIVKHIIEAHKQRINVRSKVDIGSAFTFTLMKEQK